MLILNGYIENKIIMRHYTFTIGFYSNCIIKYKFKTNIILRARYVEVGGVPNKALAAVLSTQPMLATL